MPSTAVQIRKHRQNGRTESMPAGGVVVRLISIVTSNYFLLSSCVFAFRVNTYVQISYWSTS